MPSDLLYPSFKIWNLAQRRVLATFKRHTKTVFSVDFSPNGRFLLSGSFDRSVRIWCMPNESPNKLLDPEMTFVTSAAISPNGRYIAAGNEDGILRIWDFRSGQLLQRWKPKGSALPVVCGVYIGWESVAERRRRQDFEVLGHRLLPVNRGQESTCQRPAS